ncbi:hypothetical protein N0V90_006472 [Kalmusia sp. IMI 367209]|nr:hypothetical protein N0V90_006472 [Kalmusia sp. IMI 367209]
MTARYGPSANAEIIRIPSSLSVKSEPTWKPPLRSPTSKFGTTTSHKVPLLKDVEAALSTIQPRSVPRERTKPNTRCPQGQTPAVQSQHDSSLYSNSVLVPGSRTKKRIYTLAPVLSEHWDAQEYMERFEYVQSELRRAIDRHRELRDHARSINFHLYMVGTCPRSAEPSIVIVCRAAQFKKLRALFKEKAGEKLYCGKRSRVFEMFKKGPPAKPPFNLVYYRTDHETLKRKAAWQTVSTDLTYAGVLPGAPVYYQGVQANIGVTFNIDNVILSTTVNHLFNPTSIQSSSISNDDDHDDDDVSIRSFDSDQRTLDDSDLISLDPLWADDSEDDDLEDLEIPRTVPPASPPLAPRLSTGSRDPLEHPHGHKIDSPIEVLGSAPYLDYALLQLSPSVLQTLQPNICRLNEADGGSFHLQTVATEPRFHAVPVYMISGTRGVRTGRLLGSYAYLGSNPGQESCRVWTLIFDGADGLADGDCGSVVVDQDTHTVYGHVIGSNPMDQAYVVPFKDIIEQIKLKFRTSEVSLYDPTKTSPAVRTTIIPDTIELNSGCQALVPYRRSDSYLSSLTKTNHTTERSDSQEDHTTEERSHQNYAKSYDAFTCICGRRYENLPASPLSLEEFFRKATRPTSRTEVLAFWLSMLEVIRLKKNALSLAEPVPKESASQKSLVCRRPERSVHGIRPDVMSLRVINSDERDSQPAVKWDLATSSNANISKQLAWIPPATWSKRGTSPCRSCQDLQRAYYLFSIGGLLFESLVWVLAGHDGLNDLQQSRRNSDVSPCDRGLQLFNRESVSLHAKAFANGDSASLEVLQMTERILNQDLDFPELWRWQQKISEEFERRLNTMRRKEANFVGKRTSNKRALDSFIIQNFARNPVIDPNGPDPKTPSKFRDLVRRVGHAVVRMLYPESRSSIQNSGRDQSVLPARARTNDDRESAV